MLIFTLDLNESVDELLVVDLVAQLLKSLQARDPLVDGANCVADQLGESWVAAVQPSAWGHTIGLVLELSRVEMIEFGEDRLFEKLRVQSCDTIHSVRAHNRQECHANLLFVAFFDEGHARDFLSIAGVLGLDFLEEVVVDEVDELHVSWQELCE